MKRQEERWFSSEVFLLFSEELIMSKAPAEIHSKQKSTTDVIFFNHYA